MTIFEKGKNYDDCYVVTVNSFGDTYTAWYRVDRFFFWQHPYYRVLGEFNTAERAWSAVQEYDCDW